MMRDDDLERLCDRQAATIARLQAELERMKEREEQLVFKLAKLQDQMILRVGGWAKHKYREKE